MSREADLSGFPIIRIDQIPLVDSDTLVIAQKEIKSLISSLLSESTGSVPPMVHYLRKQNEEMFLELTNRLAQERINALLSGATALLYEDKTKYPIEDDDELSTSSLSAITEKSVQKSAANGVIRSDSVVSSSFQPLPLPSELKGRGAPPAAVTSSKAMPIDTSKQNLSTPTNAHTLVRSESSPLGIAMSSRSTDGRDGAQLPGSPMSEQSSQQPAPKRPVSGGSRPSRRSQQLINEKFGSMFIVAGGERKRRPLPLKKVVESVDEKNSRERLERRKAAMQRLIARKEERQQQILAKRAKKKAAQREAELQQQAAENTANSLKNRAENSVTSSHMDSGKPPRPIDSRTGKGDVSADYASDSESVSGGDDDMEVAIDQQMIDTVAQAQRAEALSAQQQQQQQQIDTSTSRQEPLSGDRQHTISQSTDQRKLKQQEEEAADASLSYAGDSDEPEQASRQCTGLKNKENSPAVGSVAAKPKRVRTAIVSEDENYPKSTAEFAQPGDRRQPSEPTTNKAPIPSAQKTQAGSAAATAQKPKNRRASPYRDIQQQQQEQLQQQGASPTKGGSITSVVSGKHSDNSRPQESTPVRSDEQLTREFEEKNNEALSVLRSMKLRREQLKQASFKGDVQSSSSVACSSLAIMEPGADDQEDKDQDAQTRTTAHNFAIVLHSSTASASPSGFSANAALVASLDESVINSSDDAPLLAITNNDHSSSTGITSESSAPQSLGHFIKVSTVKVDDRAMNAESTAPRPNTVPVNSPERRKLLELSNEPHSDRPQDQLDDAETPHLQARRRNTALAFPSVNMLQESSETIPDLSQTTLDVSDYTHSGGDEAPPDSARTVASPSHPLVVKLLMHKNSELLYVKDDCFCSRLGPDELPGLRAWKLVSIVDECANWVVNIAKYTAIKPTQIDIWDTTPLFQRRTSQRKSVSLGLLMLLLDTEDLILGTPRLFSAEHFTTLWKEYIRLFDEKAATVTTLQHDGGEALFREVAVCGNCHAVCKKLENLLKTLFVPSSTSETEARLHRQLHAQDDVLLVSPQSKHCQQQQGDLPAHSPPRRDVRPFSGSYYDDRNGNGGRSDREGDVYQNSLQRASRQAQGPRSVQSLEFSENNTDDDADGGTGDNNGDLDSGDDEASILPLYNEVELSRSGADGGQTANSTFSNINDTSSAEYEENIPKINHAQEQQQQQQQQSETINTAICETPSRKSSKTRVKLSNFYPNIGSIFPAVYGSQSGKQGEDGSEAARLLIESMQVQCKIYEEWIEVMSDYSTVFSDDHRGVAEHYGSGGGGGGGGAEESEIEGATNDNGNAAVYKGGSRSLHFRVKSGRSEVNNIVTDVFNNSLKEWEELPAGLGLGLSWNILWTWSKPRIKMSHLLVWQRVNHYPDSKELTRKDLLKKNIQRYTNMGGKGGAQFDIMPLTFLLPHEYTAFVQAFTAAETSKTTEDANIQNFWIMKPIGMSRGRGISLVKDLSQIAYSQSSVVQRYIERPLCLKGYKFDLRLYVLVTSFKPLEAFIYRDGFARVSTHQYSLDPQDTENKFIHLTNSSIQCQNTDGPSKDSPLQAGEDEEDTGGTKISLQGTNGLWRRLAEFGIDIPALWQSICLLVIKSLVVVDDKMVHQPCCFELFGYDVLVDSELRPWLLEVNASPSLARTNALDVRVKNAMIRDIIGVIDPAPYDRAAVLRILRKRLGSIARNRFTLGRNDPDLEQDLRDILGDYVPRRYGEVPSNMGEYEMLCPGTKEFTQVMSLKKKIIKSG